MTTCKRIKRNIWNEITQQRGGKKCQRPPFYWFIEPKRKKNWHENPVVSVSVYLILFCCPFHFASFRIHPGKWMQQKAEGGWMDRFRSKERKEGQRWKREWKKEKSLVHKRNALNAIESHVNAMEFIFFILFFYLKNKKESIERNYRCRTNGSHRRVPLVTGSGHLLALFCFGFLLLCCWNQWRWNCSEVHLWIGAIQRSDRSAVTLELLRNLRGLGAMIWLENWSWIDPKKNCSGTDGWLH